MADPFLPAETCEPQRRRRQSGGIDIAPNLLLTTIAIMGATVMRAPLDNNHRHVHHQPADNPRNLILLGLPQAPPQAPIKNETSQPVRPRRAAQETRGAPNLLLSQLEKFPHKPVAGEQSRQLRRAQDTTVLPNLLLSTLYVLPGDTVFRIPLDNNQRRRRPQQDTASSNSLLSTLSVAAPAAAPFIPWEQPQGRPRRSAQAEFVSVSYSDEIPLIGPFDFTQVRPLRRGFDTSVPNLLESTLAPVVQGAPPFTPWDSHQPRQLRRVQLQFEPNNLISTLALPPPVLAPFIPWDPAQTRQLRRAQLSLEPNLLTSTLAPAVVITPPFVPWDGPQLRRRRSVPIESFGLSCFADQIPSSVFDPPQVRLRRRALDSNPGPNLLTTTLLRFDPQPFCQNDWDVPRRLRRTPDSWFPGVNALIPNVRPPYVAELPGAFHIDVDLAPRRVNVRSTITVVMIDPNDHGGGMSGETDYAAGEITKAPGTNHQLVLNFYRDCINFRLPNEPYDAGEMMRPMNGNGYAYECTVAGTTGDDIPALPMTVGLSVLDGTVEWTCRAAGLNGVTAITGPSAVAVPAGALTITGVSVVEAWKVVGTIVGGALGQSYDVVWSLAIGARPVEVRTRVHVRRI